MYEGENLMFLQPLCYWNDLQLQITCAERWNICGYSWNSIMLILKIENHYIFRVIFEKKKRWIVVLFLSYCSNCTNFGHCQWLLVINELFVTFANKTEVIDRKCRKLTGIFPNKCFWEHWQLDIVCVKRSNSYSCKK